MTKVEALKEFKFNINFDDDNEFARLKKEEGILYELWEDYIDQLNLYKEITDKQAMSWKNPFAPWF